MKTLRMRDRWSKLKERMKKWEKSRKEFVEAYRRGRQYERMESEKDVEKFYSVSQTTKINKSGVTSPVVHF